MLSWNTTRTVCAVLLLIPLVHLVYLVASDTMAILDPSPDAWANEIRAYDKYDSVHQLPEDPILVVGGQRVKLWPGLEDLLAPRPVLMRGVGDATVNDIRQNYERLIGYYQPESVVLLPSRSEFHIREFKSADEMTESIRKLVELDLYHGVTRHFYIFPPLKTTLHRNDDAKIEKTTNLLKNWAAGDERIVIVDGNSVLTDKNGAAKGDFFRSDGVNLNETGYLRLSMLLRQEITTSKIPGH